MVLEEEDNFEQKNLEVGEKIAGDGGGDEKVLKFMDSMDNYLTLLHSLSSSLSQGWLQLASAQHSMGILRISGVMLDHQPHTASTTLQIFDVDEDQPSFYLRKWGTFPNNGNCVKEQRSKEDSSLQNSERPKLCQRGSSQLSHERASTNGDSLKIDDQVQIERLKSLSVFGTLVSPKLRAAQVSFETALETLVEIANMRSAMLSSFNQIQPQHRGSRSS